MSGLVNENTLSGGTVEIVSALDSRLTSNAIVQEATLVRIRGFLKLCPLATAVSTFVTGAYGYCIVNGEAFDAGVASIISPWTEGFDDRWIYHTYWSIMSVFAVGDAVGKIQSIVNETITIDNKAMRKFQLGDVLVEMIENGSTDNCTFFSNARVLWKLH